MALDKFVINGGNRLKGEVQVSGAKNSALPILAASLLTEGTCTISGVPDLADTRAMGELLGDLGASVSREQNGRVRVRVADERQSHARYDRVRKMLPVSACSVRYWQSVRGPVWRCRADVPLARGR